MKIIKLNESQYFRLFESNGAPDFGDGDVKEFNGNSEIGTTTTIHDEDGNPQFGQEHDTDDLGSFLTNQHWGVTNRNGINS